MRLMENRKKWFLKCVNIFDLSCYWILQKIIEEHNSFILMSFIKIPFALWKIYDVPISLCNTDLCSLQKKNVIFAIVGSLLLFKCE